MYYNLLAVACKQYILLACLLSKEFDKSSFQMPKCIA